MFNKFKKAIVLMLVFSFFLAQGCTNNSTRDKLKIAYIMDPSGKSNSDNTDVIAAFEEIQSYYDFQYDIYSPKNNDNVKKQVLACYVSDYDLIIGSSYIVNNDLLENKSDYPNVNISLIGSDDTSSVSMNINFKMEEASFLAGVLAASTTKTGIIGYIGAYDDKLTNYEVGYYAGAKTVNPNIIILSNYTNSYNNVTNGYTLAGNQIIAGADIIFANCGASAQGVSKAVSEHDNVAIIDSDLYDNANNEQRIGKTVKNYKKAALYLIDSFINDNYLQSTTNCGISYDMVDLQQTDLISDQNKDLLNQYRTQIRQYSISIPSTWDNYNNFNYYSYIINN